MAALLRPVLIAAALAGLALPAAASADRPTGLTASAGAREVDLNWDRVHPADGVHDVQVLIRRNGDIVGRADRDTTSFADTDIHPNRHYRYTIETLGTQEDGDRVRSQRSAPAEIALPAYFVGAAIEDITPSGIVNQGGYGLGDGSLFPDAVIGRGGQNKATSEHIKARAVVFDDGDHAIAIA